MGTETVNHISDLNSANPLAGDNVSKGDDHIRNIKKALLADFPNINATVSATPTELDYTTVTALGTAEASKALTVSLQSTMTFNGMTVTDLGTVTTADINGGTLDGVAIGDASRSSIKGTTIDASQSLVLATGATVTGIDDGALGSSAVLLATQGAVKTYVDAHVETIDAADATNIDITLPGGLIIKMGYETINSSTTSISFTPAFTTLYGLSGMFQNTGSTGGNGEAVCLTANPSTIGAAFSTNSNWERLYWIAFGV